MWSNEDRVNKKQYRKSAEEANRKLLESTVEPHEIQTKSRIDQEAEKRTKQEAEKRTKQEAEKRTKQEAEKRTKQEAEKKVKQEVEKRIKQETEKRTKQEAEKRTKQEAENKRLIGTQKEYCHCKAKTGLPCKVAPNKGSLFCRYHQKCTDLIS